ncbi:peptidase MA family metallohydrolase [Yinghuangia sp. YIM S09857]|uniref:peptidase MA family metallohydrolase n=1 Tax=Yinghuangia sp. YIM S09857 TaxID=3436929 RepID=UPI003F536BAF
MTMEDSAPRPGADEPAGGGPGDGPADARAAAPPERISGTLVEPAAAAPQWSAQNPYDSGQGGGQALPHTAAAPGVPAQRSEFDPFTPAAPAPFDPFHRHGAAASDASGYIPYRSPRDPLGLWPNSVADPRRDRHTAGIVVCSLLAAVITLVAAITQVPERSGDARAAADAGNATAPGVGAPSGDPAAPGDKNPGDDGQDSDDGTGGSDDADEPGKKGTAAPSPPSVSDPDLRGPSASSGQRATVLNRARTLTTARTSALAANSVDAFLTPVDKNNKALVDTERRLFTNLKMVPFDESQWSADDVNDARSESGSSGTWPVTATVEVDFRHKITNVDVLPVVERYIWTLRCANAADPCTLTNVSGARDSSFTGPAGYPAPWDVWELAVERRPHVLVLGPSASAADLRVRADEAESAAAYDLARCTGPAGASPGFFITLTRERETFEKLYSRESPGDWAAGFALPLSAADDSRSIGGSRVVIDLDEMDQDREFARIILRHEMVHALLDPLTRVDYEEIPLWAAEGFADWVAQADRPIADSYEARRVGAQIADGDFTGSLPDDDEFASANEDVIDAAYNQAHLAIRYLADTYGADKACAFIADVYMGTTSRGVESAIQTATGKSLSQFEKGWAEWTRKNFG